MIILTFTRSNHSALNFKLTAGFHVTIYDLSLATVREEWLLRMIVEVCLFTNVHEINQHINKSQKSCLTGLFKLSVAFSSWRILKHRLNHIFDCHLPRIFESFQDNSNTHIYIINSDQCATSFKNIKLQLQLFEKLGRF